MQNTVSTPTLIKASISATTVAILALVFFILPAEYNIDPTGVGKRLGLTALNQSEDNSPATLSSQKNDVFETFELIVPAGKGIEFKFQMKKDSKMNYEWLTDGHALYFDLHGEPKGDTTGYFESYTIATANEVKGSFVASFDGSHGWYWKNNSESAIAIQLIVTGDYRVIGIMK